MVDMLRIDVLRHVLYLSHVQSCEMRWLGRTLGLKKMRQMFRPLRTHQINERPATSQSRLNKGLHGQPRQFLVVLAA